MPNSNTQTLKPSEVAEALALLKTDQAARALNVSRRTVQELTERRELAAIKFGRNVRYHPEDIRRFIESHRNKSIGWKNTEGGPSK
jgi:excisionase family DNA binding protein